MDPTATPPRLYHYTNARGFLGILEEEAIWATHLAYLNDAKEFDYAVELAKRVLLQRAHATADPRVQEILTELGTRLTVGGKVHVFVASFSAVGDVLSQWRGYCPDGAGYSLGFATRELIDQASTQGFFLAPCLYDEAAQDHAIEQVLQEVMRSPAWKQAVDDPGHDPSYQQLMREWLRQFVAVAPTIKHAAFHEEQEWRLISKPMWPGADPRWKIRPGRSMLIPYVPVQLTRSGFPMPIQEVIVGPTPHMDLALMAVQSWLTAKGVAWGLTDMSSGTIRSSNIPYRNW